MRKIVVLMLSLMSSLTFAGDHVTTKSPVNKHEVERAMQSLRMQSPGMVNVGDYAAVDTIETYVNRPSKLIMKEHTHVLGTAEDLNYFSFDVHYQRIEWINDQYKESSQRGRAAYRKGQPTIYENLPAGSYYDLQVQQVELGIPDLVRQRPGCGGLNDCSKPLPGKLVSYTYVDLQNREWRIEATGSHITPFMGTPMSLCASTLINYQDPYSAVTTCKIMVDFAVGR